jgi:hypothetical protein
VQVGIDEVREIFDKPRAAFDDLLLSAMKKGRRVMLDNLFKLLDKQVVALATRVCVAGAGGGSPSAARVPPPPQVCMCAQPC